jgi:spermidine synthase
MGGWFRQFTLIYGIHIKSVTAILAQGFICLSLGCWISGQIADKISKPLIVYIILISISAVYIFFHKPVLSQLSVWFNGSFWLPLMVMIIPLSLISGSFPLLIKYFIRTINHAGIYMSRTLLVIASGVIISVLISVLLLIPLSGIFSLHIAGGLSLIVSLALAFRHTFQRKQDNFQPPVGSRYLTHSPHMRFRKKRIVLETGIKLTRAMLYGSVFQAFSFSSLLIIYMRILVRYNHLNPGFFYAIVLSVIFTGMAVGSMLYGIIADKPANKYLTLAILQIVAGIASLLSFAMQQFMAPDIFPGMHNNESFIELTVRQILLCSLLVFIPSVIHGMSIPLAGRLYPKRLQQIGKTFGQLSSLVLLSLLAGIIVSPLLLIPLIGTHASYIFLSLLIVLSGVYLIVRDSRLIRAFRLAFAFSALFVFILIIVVLRMLNVSQRNRVSDGIYEGSTYSARYIFNQDSSKSVYINGDYYFGTDKPNMREQILSASIPLFVQPDVHNTLIIGFNTGIVASIWDRYGIPEIQIAEISPELIRLSSTAFSDENDDILTESSVHISVMDPRVHLLRSEDQYDLIYSGPEQILLNPGRYTTDFFRICYQKLSEKGLYCQVLPYNMIDNVTFVTIIKSLSEIFDHVTLWYLSSEKQMLIASKIKLTPEYCSMPGIIKRIENPWLEQVGISRPESILAHFICSGDLFSGNGLPENSDNLPQLQFRHTSVENQKDSLINFAGLKRESDFFRLSDTCNNNKNDIYKRVSEISLSLLNDVSPFSVVEQHDADSSASNGSPFRQYP